MRNCWPASLRTWRPRPRWTLPSPASERTTSRSCSAVWRPGRNGISPSSSTWTPPWRRPSAAPVKPGEVWKLGPHRLLCGDATKPVDVGRLMDGDKAQMTFTDPPYNVSLGDHGGRQQGKKKRRIANDALPPEEWEAFCRGWAGNLLEHTDLSLIHISEPTRLRRTSY